MSTKTKSKPGSKQNAAKPVVKPAGKSAKSTIAERRSGRNRIAAPASGVIRPDWSKNPNTAMRKAGYKLIQLWGSPKLKAAIDAHAKKTGKFKSDLLREVVGGAAEKWSGAASGSLQVLNADGAKKQSVKPAASKTAAKSDGSTTTKKVAAKSTKKAAKSSAKSSKSTQKRPAVDRSATNDTADVAADGTVAKQTASADPGASS